MVCEKKLNASLILVFTFLLHGVGCDSTMTTAEPPTKRGYVITQAPNRNGIIYASGDYRNEENESGNKLLGHRLLVIINATDSSHPKLISERDMKLTRAFAVMGEKLIAVQDGFDEENLDGTAPLVEQNIRIKVYNLTDSINPKLEKTFELPGTKSRGVTANIQVNDHQMIISTGTGTETQDGTTYTWLINPNEIPGAEIIATGTVACRASFLDENRLWCINALGKNTGFAAAFDLDNPSHTLNEKIKVNLPELIVPIDVSLVRKDISEKGISYRIAVADLQAGLMLIDLNADGVLAKNGPTKNFVGNTTSLLSTDEGFLLSQSTGGLYLLDPSTNPLSTPIEISKLIYPGVLYNNYAGGSKVEAFGPEQNREFIASLGDYGVLIFKLLDSNTLEKKGGFYRRWGTNWANDHQIQEGNY